ncbi:hypothetical protein JRQ81_009605 [Phrynocephalus forsythii]|uniref:Cystatin n=1 Tax=Phrynocephalus forsythii TaxID=171643 RepID=A0A9Q1ASN3_9SAUR|nr:hypothetical protein JRQ81_009605 [Phrynocephalus forsythii]
MVSSWTTGGLLALGFLLLLGQPAQFRPPSRATRPGLWQKPEAVMYRQAVRAHQLALDYLNQKHNTTYYRAPGLKTQIAIETVFGRAYYVNTVLVRAKCPEGFRDVDPTDCEIEPEAPMLECNMVVAWFFEEQQPWVSEDSCREIQEPQADTSSSAAAGRGS